MRAFVVRAALGAVLLPASVVAQSPPLTESEALARLSPDSPQVRAARSPVAIVRADVAAAARWPNPRVSWDREAVGGITEQITAVAQPLPLSGRRQLERSAASALVDAASSRADDQIRRTRADLRLAFADVRAAQVREQELMRAAERLGTLAGMLARREAAGDTAGFDRLRADREVLDLEADRAVAAADRMRAQGLLGSFLGSVTDPTAIVVSEQRSGWTVLPAVDVLVERAASVSGELVALRHEMEAARFAERAAGRRIVPEPEVLAGTKSSNALGGHVGSVITLQAVLPLFDRARAERGLAAARAAQAKARDEVLRLTLRSQIAALRAVTIDRRAAADRYRASALVQADELERIAQVSYDSGERGILELLDAYRTAAAARLRQAVLDNAVRQAEIELEFVSGWEIP